MDKELQALLEAVLENQARTEGKVDQYLEELNDFSERFEEVMTSLENERRLDRLADYD